MTTILFAVRAIYSGKNYTAKEAQESWDAGKDFYSPYTRYFSIRDSELLLKDGITHVAILTQDEGIYHVEVKKKSDR